ncbi:MAG TPA: hypothetical protein VIB08_11100 [Thermoanaerobaculia bacterium]
MAEHLHGYPRCETPVGTSCGSSDLHFDECGSHGALRSCEASVVDGIPTGQYRCLHDDAAPAKKVARAAKVKKARAVRKVKRKVAKARAKRKIRKAVRRVKAKRAVRRVARKVRRAKRKVAKKK